MAQYLTPNTQHPTPNTQYLTPNTQHPGPSLKSFAWRGLLLHGLLAGAGLVTACSPLRLLRPGQTLLSQVTIESEGLTSAQQERLPTLVQQKPNRRLPLPKLAIYQFGHALFDSARVERRIGALRADYAARLARLPATDSAGRARLLARRDQRLAHQRAVLEKGNAVMRLGEAPVLYDPALSRRTADQLRTYLRAQGYFRAVVSYADSTLDQPAKPKTALSTAPATAASATAPAPAPASVPGALPPPRRMAVRYAVRQGPAFTLSQFTRAVADSGVARVVAGAAGSTRLRVGEAYNEDLIGQERGRLETAIKNAGYYDFRAQYISFEADTSYERGQVRLRLLVADAPGGHRAYRLRRVLVLADAGLSRAARRAATTGDAKRGGGRQAVGNGPPLTTDSLRGTARPVPRADSAARAAGGGTGRLSTASLPAGITAAAVADTLAARAARRQRRPQAPRDTLRLDSLVFVNRGPLAISPAVLARQITLRPGQRFSLDRTQRTQRQLGGLDMFRFNNVNYSKVADDPAPPGPGPLSPTPASPGQLASPASSGSTRAPANNSANNPTNIPTSGAANTPAGPAVPVAAGVLAAPPGLLDALVTASPSPRLAQTTEIGGTYVADLLGPFANLRLKWRNPFGGAEVLELSGRAGLEGQFAQVGDGKTTSQTYTVQYGATVALVVPEFLLPIRGAGSWLRDAQPRTRFALSSTYTSSAYYTRSNTQLTLDYLWQPSPYQQYIATPVSLGLVNTPFTSDFYKQRLEELRTGQGSPLYLSFRSIFVPSFSFTSLYNSNDLNQTRNAHFLRWFVEVGGLTRGLYRQADWFTSRGLSTYNFAKISVDYRRYYRLSPSTYLAWRLNGGVARALTRSPDPDAAPGRPAERYLLPYDKYFFAGGSNSVRAWAPRRLGTGASATTRRQPDGSLARDYITEQPGEVLLEGSVEYRFPVYSFIKGAVFTDFGNVWSLPPDAQRPEAEFRASQALRQLALAAGLGVRMDFSFLILRFDFATKVYDPTDDQPWVLRRALRQTTNQTVINVGLGYPF